METLKQGKWSDYELDYLFANYQDKTIKELCKHLNRSDSSVRNKLDYTGVTPKPARTIYALYKGDEILAQGTAHEIAEKMDIALGQVYFYKSPFYKRRAKTSNVRCLVTVKGREGI